MSISPARAARTALTYSAPADTWTSALPIGNGFTGALASGEVGSGSLDLNHTAFWSGSPAGRADRERPVRAAGPEVMDRAAELIRTGRHAEADYLVQGAQGQYAESFLPLGGLRWQVWLDGQSPTERGVTNYRRELDLATGVARWEYDVDGTHVVHRAWVDRSADVVVLDASATGPAQFDIAFWVESLWPYATRERPGQGFNTTVQAPSTVAPPHEAFRETPRFDDGAAAGVTAALSLGVSSDGAAPSWEMASRTRVSSATRVTAVLGVEVGYRGALTEPERDVAVLAARALDRVDRAMGTSVEELHDRHVAAHGDLFNRFDLSLGDGSETDLVGTVEERLERGGPDAVALGCQFGRYALLCSSVAGGLPAGLRGVWSPDPRPLWSAGYTINVNVQMTYWAVHVANLTECADALWPWMAELAEHGRSIAREHYDADGWVAHHNTDPWAFAAPVGSGFLGSQAAAWPFGGVWLALHIMEQFRFTGDVDWLRQVGWPLLLGAAQGALGLVTIDPEGSVSTVPASSPENSFLDEAGDQWALSVHATANLELTRLVLLDAVAAADVLGVGLPELDQIQAVLAALGPLQRDELGRISEWGEDVKDADPLHRHISHLVGFYPGALEYNVDAWAGAETTLRSRDVADHGAVGSPDTLTPWSLTWHAALHARMRNGTKAAQLLSTLMLPVDRRSSREQVGVHDNLFISTPPAMIDGNLGLVAAVCELLVQSQHDVIDLLPALPAQWPVGTVRGLRARPGVTVDLQWNDGVLTNASVTADSDIKVPVAYGERSAVVELAAGRTVDLQDSLSLRGS